MSLTTCAQQICKDAQMDGASELPDEFWALIERYRVDQAYALLGNLEDAEDVVQETFVDALRQQQKLVGSPSVGAWLRACNRANAVDRVRARAGESNKRNKKQLEAPDRSVTTGGFGFFDIRESIAKAIEALPVSLRTVVVMHYWEHLPYDEIACRLNLSPVSVRRRLYEAAPYLYKSLRNEFTQAPEALQNSQDQPPQNPEREVKS